MKKFFTFTFIAMIVSASLASLFLHSLMMCVHFFQFHWESLIWLTPFAGITLALVSRWKYFRNCETENSPALAPYTFICACWSHLFGASMGRESAAINIGASISEMVRRRSGHLEHQRLHFAYAGVAAAFAAIFGTPISAWIFALEYKSEYLKKPDSMSLGLSFLGSLCGWGIGWILRTPHWHPPELPHWPEITYVMANRSLLTSDIRYWRLFTGQVFALSLLVAITTLLWGMLDRRIHAKVLKINPLILLPASGVILSLMTVYLQQPTYNNFSTDLLTSSLIIPASFIDFAWKFIFTAISLWGGWKGGVFVPMMVIGALFASCWQHLFTALPPVAAASIGLFAIINQRFGLPITSILLTGELLGWKAGLISVPAHLLIGCKMFFRKRPV